MDVGPQPQTLNAQSGTSVADVVPQSQTLNAAGASSTLVVDTTVTAIVPKENVEQSPAQERRMLALATLRQLKRVQSNESDVPSIVSVASTAAAVPKIGSLTRDQFEKAVDPSDSEDDEPLVRPSTRRRLEDLGARLCSDDHAAPSVDQEEREELEDEMFDELEVEFEVEREAEGAPSSASDEYDMEDEMKKPGRESAYDPKCSESAGSEGAVSFGTCMKRALPSDDAAGSEQSGAEAAAEPPRKRSRSESLHVEDPLIHIDMKLLTPTEKRIVNILRHVPVDERVRCWRKLGKYEAMRTASLCTGLGTDHLTLRVNLKYLSPRTKNVEVYTAEKKGAAQKFLKDLLHCDGDVHVFCDAEETLKARAQCCVHGRKEGCLVDKGCVLLHSGFSCVNLSGQFEGRAEYQNCVAEKKGATGITARATIDHMQIHDVSFCLVENVAQLLQEANKKNKEAFIQQCKDGGIACKLVPHDPRKAKFPQSRPRAYGLLVNVWRLGIGFEDAHDLLARWAQRVESLTKGVTDAELIEDVVLPRDSPIVTRAYKEMLRAKTNEVEAAGWADKQQLLLQSKDITWSAIATPRIVSESEWGSNILCKREQKILGLEFEADAQVRLTELVHSGGRTTSKSSVDDDAGAATEVEATSTVLPNSRMWDWLQQRLLIGDDYMRLQAYPIEELLAHDDVATTKAFKFAEMSQSAKTDMAGNAFNGVSMAIAQMAFLLEVPADMLDKAYNTVDSEDELDDVAAWSAGM